MKYTLKYTLVSLLFGLLTLLLAGCASEPERADQDVQKADTERERRTVERPPDEELARTPCGNPNWAQLPPGAEETPETPEEQFDGEPAEDEPADEPAEPTDAEQSNADEPADADQSSTELAAGQAPCK